jgi:hypothetical protein
MSSGSFLGGLTSKGGLTTGIGNQYGLNQNLENQTQGQRAAESGSVLGGYQGLAQGTGYSPQEKANIEQGTLGGVQEGYNSTADALQRRAAVTHNNAGYGAEQGELARNKARSLGQAGLQVQSDFAYQRKLQGLQGLAQMYGVDTSFLSSLGQQQQGLLGIGNSVQSRSRGVLGTIGAVGSLL